MAKVRTLQRSFAGGEITPEMLGRLDLDKYQTGLASCRNFQTLPHGPAINRAGFRYVLQSKTEPVEGIDAGMPRLIPFTFNIDQTYVLEFGANYIRFHTNGGTLLEPAKTITGISQAAPGIVTAAGHGFLADDWVYLSGISGMTQLNGRYARVYNITANTFSLHDLRGNVIDTTGFTAYASGGTVARVYTLITPYIVSELPDLHYAQSADVLTITHPSHRPKELRRLGAVNWQLTTVNFAPAISTPSTFPSTATGGPGGGTPKDQIYVNTAVSADGEESYASLSNGAFIDLTVSGNYVDVTPIPVTDAERYNIYKLSNGLYGYIGSTDGSPFRDTNYTPDMFRTPPEGSDPFLAFDDHPAAVGYFEQRRVFAGTNNRPQNFWMTRPSTESNLTSSIPVQDDDAIFYRIKANQQNAIRHLVPMNDLLILTAGAEWRLSTENSDAVTPTTISVRPQSYVGASNVQPVVTSNSVLFVQSRGAHLREMRYSWEQNSYQAADASIMAPHLFDGYDIRDMTYTAAPHQIIWAVRNDGTLLGFTYVPEHRVTAWHHHDTTNGKFRSVAAVTEGTEDYLYAVVERTIDGEQVQYVERMASRQFSAPADAFFVDAGATYSGPAVSTISSGLWHLEGQEVAILADGAVHPRRTVTNGAITLDGAASVVHIGLPIEADLQTLPLALEGAPAVGTGMLKNVTSAFLRVNRSSGIFVGPSADKLTEARIRTTEPYGSPPSLQTREVPIALTPMWGTDGAVFIRQYDPLPLSVLSISLEVEVSG